MVRRIFATVSRGQPAWRRAAAALLIPLFLVSAQLVLVAPTEVNAAGSNQAQRLDQINADVAKILLATRDAYSLLSGAECNIEKLGELNRILQARIKDLIGLRGLMFEILHQMALQLNNILGDLQGLLPKEAGASDHLKTVVNTVVGVAGIFNPVASVGGVALGLIDAWAQAHNAAQLAGISRSILANADAQVRAFADAVKVHEEASQAFKEIEGYAKEVNRLIETYEERCGKRDTDASDPAAPADAVSKGDLSITDQTGAELDGQVVQLVFGDPEVPIAAGEPAGGPLIRDPNDERGETRILKPGDAIDPNGTFIVEAPCHKPRRVTGAELIDMPQTTLENSEQKVFVQPCESAEQVLQAAREELKKTGLGFDSKNTKVSGPTVKTIGSQTVRTCTVTVRQTFRLDSGAARGANCPIDDQTLALPGGTPAPPAQDDPSIDDIDPTLDVPVIQLDREGHIDQSSTDAPAGLRPADPLFHSSGSWGQAYADQWGLRRIGFDATTIDTLWPDAGEPVIVAVIDTGLDRRHPEMIGMAWINEGEVPDNGRDDDGNGFVDDVHGWNFVDGNNDIRDLNGHGTVVAGIIAAGVDDGIGMAGVNPWARIMPIKAVDWDGNGWSSAIADSITYAADNGARVINISFGSAGLQQRELVAVAYARSKGAIVVAASGNQGINVSEHSPAGLPGVITVAATDTSDRRVGYSNWGRGVDIAAPGVDILSLRARGTDLLKFERDDYVRGTASVGEAARHYRITGTSFAAPLVSGVASLILSRNPELTAKQVTRMLLHTARDIGAPGWDQYTGYGLLDARAAVAVDPDFYALSRIFGVAVVKRDGEVFVRVDGRASADRFGRAWIELGMGEEPTMWTKVVDELTGPVENGAIAFVPALAFKGAPVWIIKLVVEHANGTRREARFRMKLN